MQQPKARGPKPQVIQLTQRQRDVLERIGRRSKSAHSQVTRSAIILKAAAGMSNQAIANTMGLHVQTVRKWRDRWAAAADELGALESGLDDKSLLKCIETLLGDAARSGVPPTFTAEQVCQIIALACESPAASERPLTHWTHGELTAEVIKRQIVESISSRSVGRFLKEQRLETASESLLVE